MGNYSIGNMRRRPKHIDHFSLWKLKGDSHLKLMTDLLARVVEVQLTLPQLKELLIYWKEGVELERMCCQRTPLKPTSDALRLADRMRRCYMSSLYEILDAWARLPEGEEREAAIWLLSRIENYRLKRDTTRMLLSVNITNLLEKLFNDEESMRVEDLHLTTLVEGLMKTNDDYEQLEEERNELRKKKKELRLGEQRKETDAAYEEVVSMLNAVCVVEPKNEALNSLVDAWNAELRHLRRYQLRRKPRKALTEKTEKPGKGEKDEG